ncbi:MAG: hypothetical protein M3198_19310 [Actinomycetota bacterium]|nr:hypothetical protein [Actinomycetota bacterium]
MIEILVIACAALLALGYVVGPMRGGRTSIEEPSDEVSEADADKRVKLGALIELEEERFSGKLSEPDFNLLRRQYENEAVAALKKLDELQRAPSPDDDLETEIARVKSELRCPSCGAPRSSGTPCPQCGA